MVSSESNGNSMGIITNDKKSGQQIKNLEVGNGFELRMLRGVEILLSHHHTLLKNRVARQVRPPILNPPPSPS